MKFGTAILAHYASLGYAAIASQECCLAYRVAGLEDLHFSTSNIYHECRYMYRFESCKTKNRIDSVLNNQKKI